MRGGGDRLINPATPSSCFVGAADVAKRPENLNYCTLPDYWPSLGSGKQPWQSGGGEKLGVFKETRGQFSPPALQSVQGETCFVSNGRNCFADR